MRSPQATWAAVGASLPQALNSDPEAVVMFNALQQKILAAQEAEIIAKEAVVRASILDGGEGKQRIDDDGDDADMSA